MLRKRIKWKSSLCCPQILTTLISYQILPLFKSVNVSWVHSSILRKEVKKNTSSISQCIMTNKQTKIVHPSLIISNVILAEMHVLVWRHFKATCALSPYRSIKFQIFWSKGKMSIFLIWVRLWILLKKESESLYFQWVMEFYEEEGWHVYYFTVSLKCYFDIWTRERMMSEKRGDWYITP